VKSGPHRHDTSFRINQPEAIALIVAGGGYWLRSRSLDLNAEEKVVRSMKESDFYGSCAVCDWRKLRFACCLSDALHSYRFA
jgi:hypothetical protein